jgi:dynein assembly factor 3
MWGFSPALDLLRPQNDGTPLRVLVAQASDIRHVLASISRRRRHGMPAVHFYLLENQIEVLARHLLMLQVKRTMCLKRRWIEGTLIGLSKTKIVRST